MRKYNQKEKRNTIIWLCLLLALGLGIGYAVLTEQLKLNGSVNYGSMAWDVGFTTAEDGGGSITSSPSVSTDKKSVTVSCNVGTSTASETCIAKAKIKNASSFAVQLESNPTITFDNTYINSVDAVWTEDNSPITALNSISAGVEKEIQITITTKELTEDMLPETSLNIPVTITMDWVESTSNNGTQITYVEKQLFTDIENVITSSAISNMTAVTPSAGPYTYQNSNIFSGKTISKIGIPVKSISDVDIPQTFTVYVVDKEPLSNLSSLTATTIDKTYELTLPRGQLGDSTTVNKMVYVDVNIPLADNQTLAFGSADDTVIWGFIRYNGTIVGNQYKFIAGALTTPATNNGNIIFDIYEKEEVELDEIESPLKTVLTGKNFSILGDSISTFEGYSNNAATTNDTIGNNKVYYPYESPVTDVNMTWWMQAANETGMNVLVNNSYSGDTIANRGKTRAMQLHDNTGDNAGTNPDIIAVYMGVNDVKNTANLSTTVFSENYTAMITNIKTTYPDADIFVFTLTPYTAPSATVTSMGADEIEVYNQVIRTVASANDCIVVDLFNDSGITEDNYLSEYVWDTGLHPNEAGMDKITETFINKLEDVYL